jgi:ABC-2 type transport system ATP-binding protein
MLAIRIRGLGRYFGPRVEFDGSARPREAWRTLLRIIGINMKELTDDNTQRTMAVAGHVLRDISLEIEHGSVVCLTGPSGSGKTVLLQILSGVIPPTAGSIEFYGPVTSLLSVGENLDTRLTASENIRVSRGYLDAPPDERARYASEVIDFAELHEFEHVPLRTFSTGMMLRLSVALALCGRPSIVLIDDVLAVGDIAFQQKCLDRLDELKQAGCTLVVAFSDEELVQQLATRVITLGGGRIVSDSSSTQLPNVPNIGSTADIAWQIVQDLPEDDVMALRSIAVDAGQDDDRHFDLSMEFEPKTGGTRCRPSVFLMRGKMVIFRSLHPEFLLVTGGGRLTWSVRIPTQILPSGNYSLMINMQTLQGNTVYAMKAQDAVTLSIRRDGEPAEDTAGTPVLAIDFPWEIEPVEGAA